MPDLNERQEAFCKAYLEHETGTEAARAAGYNGKNTNKLVKRMLRDPRVQSRIRELREDRQARTGDGPDKVIEDLCEIQREARAKEDFTAAIKAVELRGKHHGMFQTGNKSAEQLVGADSIVDRYKRAKERAQEADRLYAESEAQQHGDNVVPMPEGGGKAANQ